MPVWGAAGKAAAAAVWKMARTDSGRKAIAAAAAAASKGAAKVGTERWGQRKAVREQLKLAQGLARQAGGQLSYDTVIAGAAHTVVWVEGAPLAAFPAVDGDGALDERPELKNFNKALFKDPPPQE